MTIRLTKPSSTTPAVLPTRTAASETGAARTRWRVPSRRSAMMLLAPAPMVKNRKIIAMAGPK